MKKGNSALVIIIAVALAFVVALGVSFLGSTKGGKGDKGDNGESGLTITGPRGPEGPRGPKGEVDSSVLQSLSNVLTNIRNIVTKLTEDQNKFGAVSGPKNFFPFFGINGLNLWGYSTKLYVASTTICSFKLPTSTTTIISATVSLSAASTSQLQLGWGYDAASYAATTSGLGVATFPAGSLGSLVASSTNISTSFDTNIVLPPNGFLNLKFGGACTDGVTCTSLAGNCKVLLKDN